MNWEGKRSPLASPCAILPPTEGQAFDAASWGFLAVVNQLDSRVKALRQSPSADPVGSCCRNCDHSGAFKRRLRSEKAA